MPAAPGSTSPTACGSSSSGRTTIDRVPGITFDAYVGGRYSFLELDLDTRGELSRNQQVDWIDPLVGGRLGVHFSEHWFMLFAGDVGGFGVGSDLAWSAMGLLGYKWQGAGVEWAVLAGYKALYQDYTTGSGARQFRWDVTMHGPVWGSASASDRRPCAGLSPGAAPVTGRPGVPRGG